jgi:hypothetical protein
MKPSKTLGKREQKFTRIPVDWTWEIPRGEWWQPVSERKHGEAVQFLLSHPTVYGLDKSTSELRTNLLWESLGCSITA